MARRIYGKLNVMRGMLVGSMLRVVAWDADVDDDHMEMVPVAEDSTYSIEYSGENWDWSHMKPAISWRPDIFIKVHRKREPGVLYRSPTSQNVISITGVRIDAKLGK